jgi:L-ascorbate metabolism protein UlaG (beta-lactamase superfamily)
MGAAGWLIWSWQDRAAVTELDWPEAATTGQHDPVSGEHVTVTWLGITSLLFDDGETQVLVDGTFSRPPLFDILTQRRMFSDVATINYALAEYRLDRLAVIVPVHSHFDHAMDVGYVANRTSAVVLGSESTANIARGSNVPVNQYQILANRESRQFGNFTISLIDTGHAPIGPGSKGLFSGDIEEPLRQPARVADWRSGVAWSILIEHVTGSALVQGSAGFVEDALPEDSADVVFLGIGGLSSLGRDYMENYWVQTVQRTGARHVYPVHYDDFTKPFGDIALFPKVVDDVVKTAGWIDELSSDPVYPVIVELLPFGRPVAIFER